jgi:phosphoglycerate dehydrogenase-like enzyme
VITPHVAGSSALWLQRAYALVGDQLRRLAAGEEPINVRRHGY